MNKTSNLLITNYNNFYKTTINKIKKNNKIHRITKVSIIYFNKIHHFNKTKTIKI